MKILSKLFLILTTLVLLACEKTDDPITIESNKLIGYWLNPVRNDSITTYQRAHQLKDNDYGLAIKSDSTLIERKNSGWCGTPPISYGDFNGIWSQNDSIINMRIDFWGGLIDTQWKILSIDNTSLTVCTVTEEIIWKME